MGGDRRRRQSPCKGVGRRPELVAAEVEPDADVLPRPGVAREAAADLVDPDLSIVQALLGLEGIHRQEDVEAAVHQVHFDAGPCDAGHRIERVALGVEALPYDVLGAVEDALELFDLVVAGGRAGLECEGGHYDSLVRCGFATDTSEVDD